MDQTTRLVCPGESRNGYMAAVRRVLRRMMGGAAKGPSPIWEVDVDGKGNGDDAPSSNRVGRELQGARFSCENGLVEVAWKTVASEVKAEKELSG